MLEGKSQYIEMGGNLAPVTKSNEQLFINFHAFKENRLPFLVRVRDANQEASGLLAFMREPRNGKTEIQQTPICTLNLTLPDFVPIEAATEQDDIAFREKYELMKKRPGEKSCAGNFSQESTMF